MDAEKIGQKVSLAKRILYSIACEETQEDFAELKDLIEAAVDVAFDLVKEPLEACGISLQQSRGLHSYDWREKFEEKFERLNSIEPFK